MTIYIQTSTRTAGTLLYTCEHYYIRAHTCGTQGVLEKPSSSVTPSPSTFFWGADGAEKNVETENLRVPSTRAVREGVWKTAAQSALPPQMRIIVC